MFPTWGVLLHVRETVHYHGLRLCPCTRAGTATAAGSLSSMCLMVVPFLAKKSFLTAVGSTIYIYEHWTAFPYIQQQKRRVFALPPTVERRSAKLLSYRQLHQAGAREAVVQQRRLEDAPNVDRPDRASIRHGATLSDSRTALFLSAFPMFVPSMSW